MAVTKEQNEALTRVGPGTPMGELMRRYWQPIGAASEFDKKWTKKVKLLCEDLVLYKDRSGNFGLIEEQCAHRKVSMLYGIPEKDGIRCPYHGWKYDNGGQCIEQPNEPEGSSFKNRICLKSYPVQEMGGLLFAYLGPEPVPLLPNYDLFVRKDFIRTIGHAVIPCNWLQIMENSVDPVHVEWLHGHYFKHVFEEQGNEREDWAFTKHHQKIAFDVFEHGIVKRRLLEGESEDSDKWTVGHPLVFPNMVRVGRGGIYTFQIRVPMDDTHTYHLWYAAYSTEGNAKIPKDYPISYFEIPLFDSNGEFITDHIDGQDVMCWVTQGQIADRTQEKLGTTDRGIILYRQMLLDQFAKIEKGLDPINVFRDQYKNEHINLPQEEALYGGKHGKFDHLRQWNMRYAPNIDELEQLLFDESISKA